MNHSKSLLAATLASLGLTACGGASAPVSMSIRVGSPLATSQQPLTVDHGITIDRIQMVVRELELEHAGVQDDDTDEDAREDIERGPFLVDLSGAQLEGAPVHVVAAEIPAGDYQELELKVQKLMGAERDLVGFEEMVADDASVIVTGTIDGEAFKFVSAIDEEQEHEGAIRVDPGANNVTLNLDVRAWFSDGAGGRLDPRVEGSRSEIEANIKASIDVFEDDDHDGVLDVDDEDGSGD